MNWWRIATISTETGGEVAVAYSAPDCVTGSRMPASPEIEHPAVLPGAVDTRAATGQITDYFHKYVVDTGPETDHTGGAPRVLTTYTYVGDAGLALHRRRRAHPGPRKTWSEWRGYERVGTTKRRPGRADPRRDPVLPRDERRPPAQLGRGRPA